MYYDESYDTGDFLRIDFAEKEAFHPFIGKTVVDQVFCNGKVFWG